MVVRRFGTDMASEDESPGERDGAVEIAHEPDSHVGTTVVYAVSEATGTPVEELDQELSDYVDPDALERLFSDRLDGSSRTVGRVSFSMLDCVVTVTADGRVIARRGRDADGGLPLRSFGRESPE